ncbi:MAG: helix-turn-helix domain-containing protein [Gilvibacter sp.]
MRVCSFFVLRIVFLFDQVGEIKRMRELFYPTLDKVYVIDQKCLFVIEQGEGMIEVDFKVYHDWQKKGIYLSKGQYIKFLSADFKVVKFNLEDAQQATSKEARVLFSHLVAVGHIDLKQSDHYLLSNLTPKQEVDSNTLITASTEQWFYQNPFNASRDEYSMIFDLKETIDQRYTAVTKANDIFMDSSAQIKEVSHVLKDKVGITINGLLQQKKSLESRKEVALTSKSIKEIAFDLGFKDPAYFNRVFKKWVGKSPKVFRELFDYQGRDMFMTDLLALIEAHFKQQHKVDFYADKMHLTTKALSKKVKDKIDQSISSIIKEKLVCSSKKMLSNGALVKEVAYRHGFEEANHFSAFMKHYTGQSPTAFLI